MAGAPVGAPKPYLLRRKTGEKIYIPDTEFKIGKSQINADYTISENQVISRVHCIVRRKNGVTFIEDNNSTNGTFVDGQKLEPHKEQFLKDMESSYRHKFAKKPQLVEGNLQCLRAAMKEVRG